MLSGYVSIAPGFVQGSPRRHPRVGGAAPGLSTCSHAWPVGWSLRPPHLGRGTSVPDDLNSAEAKGMRHPVGARGCRQT